MPSLHRATLALALASIVSTCALALAACGGAASAGGSSTPGAGDLPPGFVAGPSGKLRVDDGGPANATAMPVVFVHGLAASHHVWDATLDHLRRTRRALALDLHGMGESALSAKHDYSIDSYVADLAAAVDRAQPPLPRFVLVGHSMAGAVVTAYAAAHPERVAGIFYVDPSPDVSALPPEVIQQFEAGIAPDKVQGFARAMFGGMLDAAQPATRDAVMTSLQATPAEVVSGSFAALLHYDPKPALAAYKGPRFSLVTRGNDEPGALHRLVPGIPHQVVEGVSHWLMLDDPTEMANQLDGFLATTTE
jgi:pimeloyl-ACP methyl ester carboxylesterase